MNSLISTKNTAVPMALLSEIFPFLKYTNEAKVLSMCSKSALLFKMQFLGLQIKKN